MTIEEFIAAGKMTVCDPQEDPRRFTAGGTGTVAGTNNKRVKRPKKKKENG